MFAETIAVNPERGGGVMKQGIITFLCSKCKEHKSASEFYIDYRFGKPRSCCKVCSKQVAKEYKREHKTPKVKAQQYQKKYLSVEENHKKAKEAVKRWLSIEENRKRANEKSGRWNREHSEKVSEASKAWEKRNPEKRVKLRKLWEKRNPDKVRQHRKEDNANRRKLGFTPLNKPFGDSHGHHINKEFVIYIPKEIHTSIKHSVLKNRNMEEINSKAFCFYVEQRREYSHDEKRD
jgi:hypothetical protein